MCIVTPCDFPHDPCLNCAHGLPYVLGSLSVRLVMWPLPCVLYLVFLVVSHVLRHVSCDPYPVPHVPYIIIQCPLSYDLVLVPIPFLLLCVPWSVYFVISLCSILWQILCLSLDLLHISCAPYPVPCRMTYLVCPVPCHMSCMIKIPCPVAYLVCPMLWHMSCIVLEALILCPTSFVPCPVSCRMSCAPYQVSCDLYGGETGWW